MSDNPVRQVTLDSLLMTAKPLTEIVNGATNWADIAKELKDVFLPYWKTDVLPEDQATYAAHLCTIYYAYDKARVVHALEDAQYVAAQITPTVDFLQTLMTANGQWDYIESQEWYIKGEYIIAIDVNYYPERSGFKAFPEFHKDTGGNNIFVNLIFDNKTDIEKTEWFADLAAPSEKRRIWQESLLPPFFLTELSNARLSLQKLHGPDSDVHGGISKGQHICVCWVDDLIWHSTPSTARRFEYTAAAAQRSYAELKKTVASHFAYFDSDFNAYINGAAILGTIAECPTTQLHTWLRETARLTIQDINQEVAKKAWTDLYHDNEARYIADAKERAKTDWRITGILSEATAEDDRLAGTTKIAETPITLAGRRRANSREENKIAIEEVRLLNAKETRSFLRTWVRILPINSKELSDNKIVFK